MKRASLYWIKAGYPPLSKIFFSAAASPLSFTSLMRLAIFVFFESLEVIRVEEKRWEVKVMHWVLLKRSYSSFIPLAPSRLKIFDYCFSDAHRSLLAATLLFHVVWPNREPSFVQPLMPSRLPCIQSTVRIMIRLSVKAVCINQKLDPVLIQMQDWEEMISSSFSSRLCCWLRRWSQSSVV